MHRNHDLIGSSEASNLCNVDRATFNRWAANGEIEPVGALPGRTGARLYARTDVLALADRKAVAA
ncbi:MAG: helix-turn-helix domain-containing protein [Nocardioidaceae bacterium]